jgi:hypothetical protein
MLLSNTVKLCSEVPKYLIIVGSIFSFQMFEINFNFFKFK